MTLLLQRICWNSNDWRGPTGEEFGKEQSYVGENGFGHEDWNLNTADLIDGKIHGYTYYNPPSSGSLGPHDIYFFAITPKKERVLVGAYLNARFLDLAERQQLKDRLRGSEYLKRRADELLALNLPNLQSEDAAIDKLLQDFAINVEVDPANVVILLPHRSLDPSLIGGRDPSRLNRYTMPTFLDGSPIEKSIRPPPPAPAKGPLIEDAYVRFTPAQQRVIRRRHNELSNRFQAYLSKLKASEIKAEKDSVDVSCVFDNRSCLFELKTCYPLLSRLALREALGQVLEYAFYPGRPEPDCVGIVLDAVPSDTDLGWFQRLVKGGIAIELFWLVGEELRSAKLTDHPLAQGLTRPRG